MKVSPTRSSRNIRERIQNVTIITLPEIIRDYPDIRIVHEDVNILVSEVPALSLEEALQEL